MEAVGIRGGSFWHWFGVLRGRRGLLVFGYQCTCGSPGHWLPLRRVFGRLFARRWHGGESCGEISLQANIDVYFFVALVIYEIEQ